VLRGESPPYLVDYDGAVDALLGTEFRAANYRDVPTPCHFGTYTYCLDRPQPSPGWGRFLMPLDAVLSSS
jgi:hypothetical protein